MHHFISFLCYLNQGSMAIYKRGNIIKLFTGHSLKATKVHVNWLTWMTVSPENDQQHVNTARQGLSKATNYLNLGKSRVCKHIHTSTSRTWAVRKNSNLYIYLAKLSWLNAPVVASVCLYASKRGQQRIKVVLLPFFLCCCCLCSSSRQWELPACLPDTLPA